MGLVEKVKDFEWQGLARAVRPNSGNHRELQGEDEGDEEQGIASPNAAPRKRKASRKGRWLSFDEDNVQTNTIIRGTQTFFLLVALFILIAIAAFQSSNDVGPSALTGIAFVPVIAAFVASVFLLAVPLIHDRTGKLKSINRNTSQVRFNAVIGGLMVLLLMLFAIIYSVSGNADGCKNVDDDPNADKNGYKDKIPGHCRNKRALAAFLWFAFAAWCASLVVTFVQWRSYRRGGANGRPFEPPTGSGSGYDAGFDEPGRRDDDDEDADAYGSIPPPPMSHVGYGDSSYAGRQSGAYLGSDRPFEDPLPSSYRTDPYSDAVRQDNQPSYSDPYDVIRRELEFDANDHPQTTQHNAPQIPPLAYDR